MIQFGNWVLLYNKLLKHSIIVVYRGSYTCVILANLNLLLINISARFTKYDLARISQFI